MIEWWGFEDDADQEEQEEVVSGAREDDLDDDPAHELVEGREGDRAEASTGSVSAGREADDSSVDAAENEALPLVMSMIGEAAHAAEAEAQDTRGLLAVLEALWERATGNVAPAEVGEVLRRHAQHLSELGEALWTSHDDAVAGQRVIAEVESDVREATSAEASTVIPGRSSDDARDGAVLQREEERQRIVEDVRAAVTEELSRQVVQCVGSAASANEVSVGAVPAEPAPRPSGITVSQEFSAVPSAPRWEVGAPGVPHARRW